jgi:hypothetical protein
LKDLKLEKRIRCYLPIGGKWRQVGVIVGKSGGEKSSVARRIPKSEYFKGQSCYVDFKYSPPDFPDDFPADLSVKEVVEALCSSGFVEHPVWPKITAASALGKRCESTLPGRYVSPKK